MKGRKKRRIEGGEKTKKGLKEGKKEQERKKS